MKRIGNAPWLASSTAVWSLRGNTLFFRDNKTAANGKEDPLQQQSSVAVERRKAHAVGMRSNVRQPDTSDRDEKAGASPRRRRSRDDQAIPIFPRYESRIASLRSPPDRPLPASDRRVQAGWRGRCHGHDRLAPASHKDRPGWMRSGTSALIDSSSVAKRRAARIGPMVWELEGPMPILNSSKRLCFTASP